MNILALDPGAANCGWACINGEGSSVLGLGVMTDSSDPKLPFNVRLDQQIFQFMGEFEHLLDTYDIGRVVWEIVPSFGDMSSKTRVISSAVILKVLVFQRGLSFISYAPVEWKKKFTGNHKCTKKEVQLEVLKRFPMLEQGLRPDESDALGIALTSLGESEDRWQTFVKV